MDVKLPNLGEGADSGTVVGILVKPGAQIKKGQSIIELETGKAVAPIPSPAAGTVKEIRVKEGDKIAVGALLLSLDEAAGTGTATAAAPSAPEKKPATKAREGVNPFTGEKMMFKAKPASKKVRVMPLKSLKGMVN